MSSLDALLQCPRTTTTLMALNLHKDELKCKLKIRCCENLNENIELEYKI